MATDLSLDENEEEKESVDLVDPVQHEGVDKRVKNRDEAIKTIKEMEADGWKLHNTELDNITFDGETEVILPFDRPVEPKE